jgi:DNA-directed RNA polymerase subunit E'/Rpb7
MNKYYYAVTPQYEIFTFSGNCEEVIKGYIEHVKSFGCRIEEISKYKYKKMLEEG